MTSTLRTCWSFGSGCRAGAGCPGFVGFARAAWVAVRVGGDDAVGDHSVQYFHAAYYFAQHRILRRDVGERVHDEEFASVRAWALVAHCAGAAVVRFRAGYLVRETVARAAFFHLVEVTALQDAQAGGVRQAPALGVVVEVLQDQAGHVRHCAGGGAGAVEPDGDRAVVVVDGHVQCAAGERERQRAQHRAGGRVVRRRGERAAHHGWFDRSGGRGGEQGQAGGNGGRQCDPAWLHEPAT